ncbi:hypothetical protein [Vibrio phage LV6]|nr:hypothetical protein [Vibrio phage LV6]
MTNRPNPLVQPDTIPSDYHEVQADYLRLQELHKGANPRGLVMDYIHPNKLYDLLANPCTETATKYYLELIRFSALNGWAGVSIQTLANNPEVRELYRKYHLDAVILVSHGIDITKPIYSPIS